MIEIAIGVITYLLIGILLLEIVFKRNNNGGLDFPLIPFILTWPLILVMALVGLLLARIAK